VSKYHCAGCKFIEAECGDSRVILPLEAARLQGGNEQLRDEVATANQELFAARSCRRSRRSMARNCSDWRQPRRSPSWSARGHPARAASLILCRMTCTLVFKCTGEASDPAEERTLVERRGVAVVTGASRGIGRALALHLSKAGFDVFATMRNPDDGAALLEQAASSGWSLRVAELDVVKPQQFEIPPSMTLFVNNAVAQGIYLPTEETADEHWRRTFETNLFGPLELIRRSIPTLRANGGTLLTIGTLATLSPLPFFGPYRASKAAMSAACETLRIELAPFGVRVLEGLPGPIETDALETSSAGRQVQPSDDNYEPMARRQHEIDAGMRSASSSTVDEAAQDVVDAILSEAGPFRFGIGGLAKDVLRSWRRRSDEELAARIFSAYGVDYHG